MQRVGAMRRLGNWEVFRTDRWGVRVIVEILRPQKARAQDDKF
jgi:hypothetical protein